MNRARQDAITTEIMEIVGGAEALQVRRGRGTPLSTSTSKSRLRLLTPTVGACRHDISTENEPKLKEGRVVAIAGPVVDIEFPHDGIPEINYAVEMTIDVGGESVVVTAEVAQQLGEGRVRAVCLKPTDGLTRGAVVTQHWAAASRCRWAKRCSATSST